MDRRPECNRDEAAEDAFDAAIVEERALDVLPTLEDCIAEDDVEAYLESIMGKHGRLEEYREFKRLRALEPRREVVPLLWPSGAGGGAEA